MRISDPQNPRITKPADSEYLEELASRSGPVSTRPSDPEPEGPLATSSSRMPLRVEADPRPTSEIAKDELLGLLHMADPTSSPSLPDPPRSVQSDLRPTGKISKDELLGLRHLSDPTSSPSSEDRAPAGPRMANARLVRTGSTSDDFQTQRMQAEHFQALLQDGQAMIPITPALLESVDWYKEADVGAQRAMTGPREPEAILEELGRTSWDDDITAIASNPPGWSSEEPEMTTSPERRPSAPPPRRVAVEMSPILGPSEPRPYAAQHAHRHTTLPPAPAPSARLRLLLSLLLLAVIGAFIGLAIPP
jgi:hypothetical protein